MTTSHRHHEPYHERRLEQQMLDTLMRIEELLRPKPEPEEAERRTPDSPDAIKDPDGHTVGYKAKTKAARK